MQISMIETEKEIEKFAIFIRKKRESVGLSVADLTYLVIGNRKSSYISEIELGSRKGITIMMMEKILIALKCEIIYSEK